MYAFPQQVVKGRQWLFASLLFAPSLFAVVAVYSRVAAVDFAFFDDGHLLEDTQKSCSVIPGTRGLSATVKHANRKYTNRRFRPLSPPPSSNPLSAPPTLQLAGDGRHQRCPGSIRAAAAVKKVWHFQVVFQEVVAQGDVHLASRLYFVSFLLIVFICSSSLCACLLRVQ